MCTVTWLANGEDGSYALFCNRDERHERAEAAPPALHEPDGARFLAPTDPDGGGTWIAVNECGVALCLLNGYVAEDDLLPSAAFTSRGLLVQELATLGSADDVLAGLARTSLKQFRSFRLLVLAPGNQPRVAFWSRAAATLSEESPTMPLVSCPVRTSEVLATRRGVLEQLVATNGGLDDDVLREFHESRHPDGWIWSVAMHHDVAATRSLTVVRTTPTIVEMTYTPGRPGDVEPRPPLAMARAT